MIEDTSSSSSLVSASASALVSSSSTFNQRPSSSGSVTFDSSLARFPNEGNRGQNCPLFPSRLRSAYTDLPSPTFSRDWNPTLFPCLLRSFVLFLFLPFATPRPLSLGGIETSLSFVNGLFGRLPRLIMVARMAPLVDYIVFLFMVFDLHLHIYTLTPLRMLFVFKFV